MARPRVTLQPDGLVPRGEVRSRPRSPMPTRPGRRLRSPYRLMRRASSLARATRCRSRRARAYLVVQTDGGAAARFDLGAALIAIGRAADNDVILDDPQVSRHHCQLKLQHGAYGFVDLQSRNGSTVNGRRVEEIALADGDRIRVGNTSVEFRLRG